MEPEWNRNGTEMERKWKRKVLKPVCEELRRRAVLQGGLRGGGGGGTGDEEDTFVSLLTRTRTLDLKFSTVVTRYVYIYILGFFVFIYFFTSMAARGAGQKYKTTIPTLLRSDALMYRKTNQAGGVSGRIFVGKKKEAGFSIPTPMSGVSKKDSS